MEILGYRVESDFVRDLALVFSGSIIALLAQMVFFILEGLRESRKTKQALYSEFLICIRHGFRIYFEIFRLDRDTDTLTAELEMLNKDTGKVKSLNSIALLKREVAKRKGETLRLKEATRNLEESLHIYVERMDEVISRLYLVAPEHVTDLAVIIRKAFDLLIESNEDLTDMEDTFEDFAKFLRRDSRSTVLGLFHIIFHYKKFRNWTITRKIVSLKLN